MAFRVTFLASLVLGTANAASAGSSVNFPSLGAGLCTLPDGAVSKCALVTDCPSALKALRQRQPLPARCGFKGHVEIVCCPDLRLTSKKPVPGGVTITTTTTTEHNSMKRSVKVGARSAEACARYTKNAFPRIALFVKNGLQAGLGELPHMALLGFPYNRDIVNSGPTLVNKRLNATWACCGTLISEKFVLTAAHCVQRSDPFIVRLGDLDWASQDDGAQPKEFRVKKVSQHPEFRRDTLVNDIALLELSTPVPFNWLMQPACLPPPGEDEDSTGRNVTVSGWGDTEFGATQTTSLLMKANLRLVPFAVCNATYVGTVPRGLLREGQMCAVDAGGQADACTGDSGGPLQVKPKDSHLFKVVGVVSAGLGCGGTKPGLYTRVSGYIEWIENIVWPKK